VDQNLKLIKYNQKKNKKLNRLKALNNKHQTEISMLTEMIEALVVFPQPKLYLLWQSEISLIKLLSLLKKMKLKRHKTCLVKVTKFMMNLKQMFQVIFSMIL